MGMTLLHARRAHHDEASARAQLFDVPCPAITHAGPQPADQLINKRRQGPFVRHASFDPLGHQLAAVALRRSDSAFGARRYHSTGLSVTFARAGDHGAERAHAAINLEAASFVD